MCSSMLLLDRFRLQFETSYFLMYYAVFAATSWRNSRQLKNVTWRVPVWFAETVYVVRRCLSCWSTWWSSPCHWESTSLARLNCGVYTSHPAWRSSSGQKSWREFLEGLVGVQSSIGGNIPDKSWCSFRCGPITNIVLQSVLRFRKVRASSTSLIMETGRPSAAVLVGLGVGCHCLSVV